MDFNDFHRISIDFNEFEWISLNFYGFLWISMDFNGFLIISIDFNEFGWISSNLNDFQWISSMSIDFHMEFIENLVCCYSKRLHVPQAQCNVKMHDACTHRDAQQHRALARTPGALRE